MSLHINAKLGDIAKVVLMPGDPLRAKHIADSLLKNVRLVGSTRNVLYFTGTYNDTEVTIGASGMGCPSTGIYTYELYNEFAVECIMRIGTAGSYSPEIKVYDVINVDRAYSESTYAKYAFGSEENYIDHQGSAYDIINEVAANINTPILKGAIHSSDVFYRQDPATPSIVTQNNCLAVEMEAFALFANARHFKKMAATIVTISDVIPTGQGMSADQRERSLESMSVLALESAVEINSRLG